MKHCQRWLLILACLACAAWQVQAVEAAAPPVKAAGTLQAAFAPWDNIEDLIVEAIDQARQQILVQAYLLTSKRIAAALLHAHRRGVEVKLLADAGQMRKTESSRVAELASAGIPVWLETAYENAHNKVIVVDAATAAAIVITGSYNFTWTAQHRNAENVLIARGNHELALRYAANWERHQRAATPYPK